MRAEGLREDPSEHLRQTQMVSVGTPLKSRALLSGKSKREFRVEGKCPTEHLSDGTKSLLTPQLSGPRILPKSLGSWRIYAGLLESCQGCRGTAECLQEAGERRDSEIYRLDLCITPFHRSPESDEVSPPLADQLPPMACPLISMGGMEGLPSPEPSR